MKNKTKDSPLLDRKVHDIRKESFGLLVKKVHLRIEKELELRVKDIGLELKTFGIIMLLLEEDGLTHNELALRAEIPGYATTRVLDQLVEQGLVTRKPHPTSRRSQLIFLTAKGKKYRQKLPALIAQVNEDFLHGCTKNEREVMQHSLKKILIAPV